MKDFKQRRDAAKRRALDAQPEHSRTPLAMIGARDTACDGCQACCFVQAIHALGKRPYAVCEHQCSVGCAIYRDKPAECSVYRCAYSLGGLTGGLEMRPDKIGLVVDFRPALGPDGVEHAQAEDLITLWEVWPGAALSDRGFSLIERVVDMGHNSCLVPFDAPPLDAARVKFVRLFSSLNSRAADGVFNVTSGPRARQLLEDAINQIWRTT